MALGHSQLSDLGADDGADVQHPELLLALTCCVLVGYVEPTLIGCDWYLASVTNAIHLALFN